MKDTLVFATNNAHKLEEVQAMVGDAFMLKSLDDISCTEDIAETGTTFAANAGLKSHYVFEKFGLDCFGDDSGLVIDALNGEPGVYSARYSGSRDSRLNLDLVLEKMQGLADRKARFVTVISLMWQGKEYLFEGNVEGRIATEPSGMAGFGYDPIFIPDGYTVTFAEMDAVVKNAISHRGRAMQQLVAFLKQQG